MSKAKKRIKVDREGGFIFLMSVYCFIFVFQVERFTFKTLLICAFDLYVDLFVKTIGRRGTVISVCRVIVRLVLTSLFVRGRGCWSTGLNLCGVCRHDLPFSRRFRHHRQESSLIVFHFIIVLNYFLVLPFIWSWWRWRRARGRCRRGGCRHGCGRRRQLVGRLSCWIRTRVGFPFIVLFLFVSRGLMVIVLCWWCACDLWMFVGH